MESNSQIRDPGGERGREPAGELIREYLLLGLRFDRIESGYVDAFTGDPELRRVVENEPVPHPVELASRADELLAQIPPNLDRARADFIAAHLRALACAGRKFAGEPIADAPEALNVCARTPR